MVTEVLRGQLLAMDYKGYTLLFESLETKKSMNTKSMIAHIRGTMVRIAYSEVHLTDDAFSERVCLTFGKVRLPKREEERIYNKTRTV